MATSLVGTRLLHAAPRPRALCGGLLLGALLSASVGCGGSQSSGSTTAEAEPAATEAAAEPAPAPRPRGTATPLAPTGADRTLATNPRPPSTTQPDTFVEPPRAPRGQVQTGEATEDGPYFDAAIVEARLHAVGGDITACYERELASHPGLHGTMNIEFRLLPSGSVVDVIAIQNSVSPTVASCVTAVIGALRFSPGPVGGSILYRYPFEFEPGRR